MKAKIIFGILVLLMASMLGQGQIVIKENTAVSLPCILIDDTDFKSQETGVAGSSVTVKHKHAADSSWTTKNVSASGWDEIGDGVYEIDFNTTDIGSESGANQGLFLYMVEGSGYLTYYGSAQMIPQSLKDSEDDINDIKTKTDNLPTDPADASDVLAQIQTVNDTVVLILADTSPYDTDTERRTALTGGDWTISTQSNLTAGIIVLTSATENQIDYITNGSLVDDFWDETLTGATHNIATSAGRRLREIAGFAIHTETAQGGTSDTITLDAGASSVDEIYNRDFCVIVEGAGAGQTRIIVEYNGTSKVATVDRIWKVNPNATSVFQILANDVEGHPSHGYAQAGAASTITLESGASSDDDVYIGDLVYISTGAGATQSRLITDYNGTTKVATVSPVWSTQPNSTSVYHIDYGSRVIVDTTNDKTGYSLTSATELQIDNIENDTNEIQGNQSNFITAIGFSTHAAADIWTVGTRTLTAVNWSIFTDWSTFQDWVWNKTVRTITGGALTTPSDYKADVSGLATQSNLTSGIVVLTSATEGQIDRILTATEIKQSSVDDVAATTTKFDTTLTEANDFWNRGAVLFTSGNNNGQMRRIKDFANANGEITVQTALNAAPADNDTFIIVAERAFLTVDIEDIVDATWDENMSDHTTDGTFGGDFMDADTWTPTKAGYLDQSLSTTESNIKANTTAEADRIITQGDSAWAGGDNASTVADAVLDELLSEHTTVGTFGYVIQYLYDIFRYGGGRIV